VLLSSISSTGKGERGKCQSLLPIPFFTKEKRIVGGEGRNPNYLPIEEGKGKGKENLPTYHAGRKKGEKEKIKRPEGRVGQRFLPERKISLTAMERKDQAQS